MSHRAVSPSARRHPRIALLIALLLIAVASPLAAQERDGESLVLNAHPWPPYFFALDDERPGFAREVLEGCLHELGQSIRHEDLVIKRMFEALESGDLDVHVMSRKPEREAFAYYGSEPLFSAVYRPAVRRGSGIRIDGIEDFDALRIGHMDGLTYAPEFEAYIEKRLRRRDRIDVVLGDEQMERLLQMLVTGRFDVMVNITSTVVKSASSLGLLDQVEILDFEVKRSDYFVVVSKRSRRVEDPEALLAEVDQCIRDVRASGRYGELARSYELVAPGSDAE